MRGARFISSVLIIIAVLGFYSSSISPVSAAPLFQDGQVGSTQETAHDFGAWSGTRGQSGLLPNVLTTDGHHGEDCFNASLADSYNYIDSYYDWPVPTYVGYARAQFKYISFPASGTYILSSWFEGAGTSATLIGMGVENIAGTVKFCFVYQNSSGSTRVTIDTPLPVLDTDYSFKVKNVVSTTVGEARGWIDGTEQFTFTDLDNNEENRIYRWHTGIWDVDYNTGSRQTHWDCAIADTSDIAEETDTAPTYGEITVNSTVAGLPAKFSCVVADDAAIDFVIPSTNNSGSWTNATALDAEDGYSFVANLTVTLNPAITTVVSVKYYANDTSGQWSASDIHDLIVGGAENHNYTGIWLHTDGTELYDASNQSFRLYTVNMQYGSGEGFNLTDVQKVKSMGFNAIRICIYWGQAQPYNNTIQGIDQTVFTDPTAPLQHSIDEVVDWCIQEDLYLMLLTSWTETFPPPSWAFEGITDENDRYEMLINGSATIERDGLTNLWRFISNRYNDVPNVIYEFLNEPAFSAAGDADWAGIPYRELNEKVISAIEAEESHGSHLKLVTLITQATAYEEIINEAVDIRRYNTLWLSHDYPPYGGWDPSGILGTGSNFTWNGVEYPAGNHNQTIYKAWRMIRMAEKIHGWNKPWINTEFAKFSDAAYVDEWFQVTLQMFWQYNATGWTVHCYSSLPAVASTMNLNYPATEQVFMRNLEPFMKAPYYSNQISTVTFGDITVNSTDAGQTRLSTVIDGVPLNNAGFKYETNSSGTMTNKTVNSFPWNINLGAYTEEWTGSEGTVINVVVYANNTSDEWFKSSEYQFIIGGEQEMPDRWQFTFDHRDRDNNIVDSQITQSLWNATQQLTYTEGEHALLDGTYTLKTYYRSHQINETSLPTATYGNTTVTINLEMKEQAWGYIVGNNTFTTLTINEQTTQKLRWTPEGTGTFLMLVDVTEKPAYVSKDGVNQTEGTTWNYAGGLVVIESALSVWETGCAIVNPQNGISIYIQMLISALTSILTTSLFMALSGLLLLKLAPADGKLRKELQKYINIIIGLCLLSAMLCTLGLLAYV